MFYFNTFNKKVCSFLAHLPVPFWHIICYNVIVLKKHIPDRKREAPAELRELEEISA